MKGRMQELRLQCRSWPSLQCRAIGAVKKLTGQYDGGACCLRDSEYHDGLSSRHTDEFCDAGCRRRNASYCLSFSADVPRFRTLTSHCRIEESAAVPMLDPSVDASHCDVCMLACYG